MSPRLRSALILAAKLVVAAGILGAMWASGKLTGDDITAAFGKLIKHWPAIPLCFLLLALVPLLGALRWRMLLACQGFVLSYARVLHLVLVGLLFNCIGIGYTGGDVVKAYYAAAASPHGRRAEAVTTVAFDRAVGMFALLLLGALAMLSRPGTVWASPELRLAAIGLLAALLALLAAFLLTLSGRVRRFAEAPGRLSRLPGGRMLLRIYQTLVHYRSQPGVLLAATGVSLGSHAMTLSLLWLLGRVLELPPISPFEFVFCVTVAVAASSVGLPLGIGLGQGAFGFLFARIWGQAGYHHGGQLATLYQGVMLIFFLAAGLPAFLAARREVAAIHEQVRRDEANAEPDRG